MPYTMNSPVFAATNGRAQSLLTYLIRAVQAWAIERKSRRMMAQLPDRILKDSGMIRDDLCRPLDAETVRNRSCNW